MRERKTHKIRTIKFRAWCPTNKIMYYPYFAGLNSGELLKRFDTVMQYTGLKDKNGKEIYEGDIVGEGVKFPNATYLRGQVARINWVRDNFVAQDNKTAHQIVERWVEVIGNIYENPELIKGE